MNPNIIEALLHRYLKGETSHVENELVENWLEENGNFSQWQSLNHIKKEEWLEDTFNDIKNSIRANECKTPIISKRKILWRKIAAAAAIIIILSFGYYLEWPTLQNHLQPAQLITLNVPLNQQKQITLPDGSKVWINAGSKLKYSKAFKGKTREVYLSGEAFFDIEHDASKPFIVHTGKLITTVLGTAFNIKEDKKLNTIAVTVTRGKVSVANGKTPLGFIVANQQISFNLLNSKSFQTQVDANKIIAWQEKELHFEDITFANAAIELQQRFGVKIIFNNDKIKECRFTGTALPGEKLEKILLTICSFNNATYQIKPNGDVIIDGVGCSNNN